MTGDEHLRWETVKNERKADCRIFTVVESFRKDAAGKEGSFFLLEAPDWVNVIAVSAEPQSEGLFIMVRQYRHGSDSVTVEFPAGLVDGHEEPSAAALRELEEETGFVASELHAIGKVNPNPAFMNNSAYIYLALGCRRNGRQKFDEHENVVVELLPVEQVLDSLGIEPFVNGITCISGYFFERWRKRIGADRIRTGA